MEVGDNDILRIPVGNLRVPRAAFREVWQLAEELGRTDAYAAGVAITCRWVACATVVFNGRPSPAYAPITHTRRRAHEELLEREYQAAEKESLRIAELDIRRQAIVEGATDTLRWVWKARTWPALRRYHPANAG